jgi:hypothetical protein
VDIFQKHFLLLLYWKVTLNATQSGNVCVVYCCGRTLPVCTRQKPSLCERACAPAAECALHKNEVLLLAMASKSLWSVERSGETHPASCTRHPASCGLAGTKAAPPVPEASKCEHTNPTIYQNQSLLVWTPPALPEIGCSRLLRGATRNSKEISKHATEF